MIGERALRLTIRAAAAGLAALAAGPVHATGPISVVYETRVRIEAQLVLQTVGAAPQIHDETLTGEPGERFVLAHVVPLEPDPVAVGVVIVARPDEASGGCSLRVEAEVREGNDPVLAVDRNARVDAGRLLLTEIWSDADRARRLILTLVAHWETVPQITTLVAGAEPLDLLVEVLLGDGQAQRVVERHRLGGIVGSPVKYTFRQLPGATGAVGGGEDRTSGELVLELTPHSIDDGRVDLGVRLAHAGASPYSDLASMGVTLRESLPPGFSLRLPLPHSASGPPLTFKVTPYF